jgi:hypothetical protein
MSAWELGAVRLPLAQSLRVAKTLFAGAAAAAVRPCACDTTTAASIKPIACVCGVLCSQLYLIW